MYRHFSSFRIRVKATVGYLDVPCRITNKCLRSWLINKTFARLYMGQM